jgi:hypothetical protein
VLDLVHSKLRHQKCFSDQRGGQNVEALLLLPLLLDTAE